MGRPTNAVRSLRSRGASAPRTDHRTKARLLHESMAYAIRDDAPVDVLRAAIAFYVEEWGHMRPGEVQR